MGIIRQRVRIMASASVITPGYIVEAVVIIVGVMTLTFVAKRQLRKRNKLAF